MQILPNDIGEYVDDRVEHCDHIDTFQHSQMEQDMGDIDKAYAFILARDIERDLGITD